MYRLTDQVVVSDNPEIEQLLELLQEGLPLVARPYAELGEALGWSEDRVIETMTALSESDRVRRMGIVVKHHALGFRANAMVVWDIPDHQVDAVAEQLSAQDAVTLCYQRPRRLPDWPYNLFCMIHGRKREQVLEKLAELVEELGLSHIRHEPLFSTRCYKQCGGRYLKAARPMATAMHAHHAAAMR